MARPLSVLTNRSSRAGETRLPASSSSAATLLPQNSGATTIWSR
jgi:hypothetical protein